MVRISYVDHDDLDEADRDLIDSSTPPEALQEAYKHLMTTRTRNSYRAIAHHPDILRSFRDFVEAIKRDGGLTVAEQEYVILCCAREIPSKYEWHNHVRIALNAGVDSEAIQDIAAREYHNFEPGHEALLKYVQSFLTGDVSDERHADLAGYYADEAIVAICLFAGYWLMNARVVDALNVDLEEAFVGWNLEEI